MSTKIHEAYVITAADPWPVLWSIRERAEAEVVKRLRAVYTDIVTGRAHEQALWWQRANEDFYAWDAEAKGGPMLYLTVCASRVGPKPESMVSVLNDDVSPGQPPGWDDASRWLSDQYTEQLGDMRRNQFNLDVSICVWVDGGTFYLIPWCDRASLMSGALELMSDHPGLEDFAYWNNTDRPDEISQDEWSARGETWGRLLASGHDFVLPILDRDRLARLDPVLDLWREHGGRNAAGHGSVGSV